ncbi:MAG: glycosyltransferase family 4 protein [Gaiellaceae bacterium]
MTTELRQEAGHRVLRDSRPLHVVYLGHSAEPAGSELGLVELITALGDRVDAHVILAADGPIVDMLERRQIRVEVIPMAEGVRRLERRRLRLRELGLPRATVVTSAYAGRLARRLRRLGPDLVHVNTLKALFYGGLAARLARVPIVWHVHDRIADDYLPHPAVWVLRALGRHAASGVIANSETTLESLGPLAVPNAIVYPPVRLECGDRPSRAGDPFVVGMVGRLAPWKGQDVFIRAFARAFPGGEERAVVVGAPLFGELEYERSLYRLVQELGLEGRVEFRGFREDVPAELERVDALVHASLLAEPFGRVVVEGMAAGLPVVAAAAGGPAEILTHGVDGLLFPPGDEAALASELLRLAERPELGEGLGAAAAERSRAFGPEVAAEGTVELYERVLAASGSDRR